MASTAVRVGGPGGRRREQLVPGRPHSFAKEPYGLAISLQHPDFVRFVNAVLAQERADGAWAAGYARWVGTPVPHPPAARYAS